MKEKEAASMHHGANTNSSGVVGVVLGIFAVLFILFLPILSVLLGIIGLIFSILQHKKMKSKWSLAGIILNALGIVVGIVVGYFSVIYLAKYAQQLQQLQNLQNAQP